MGTTSVFSKRFFGGFLKTFNANSKLLHQSSRQMSIQSSSSTTESNINKIDNLSKFKYQNTCVVLDIPKPSSMLHLLMNDNILSYVIKNTEKSIVVYLQPNEELESQNKQEVMHYMSNIYSELWDEMVHLKRLNLQCYVTSSEIHKSSYLQTSSFDAIYLNETRYKDMIEVLSIQNKIVFEDISKFDIQISENKLYFFDTFDSIPTYKRVAVGGSFDQLHNGHRKLLTYAASYCSDTFIIGITADSMLTKKNHSDLIAPFSSRKSCVLDFLHKIFPVSTSPYIDIHELKEPYGPAIVDNEIEALAVSSETLPGAFKINEIRKERGLKPIDILVLRRTDNAILSSTFIRDRIAESNKQKL